MKITVINGTNREGNRSRTVTERTAELAKDQDHEVSIVTLDNFKDLFLGEYITLDNASGGQKEDLENIRNAQVLIFVIPVYNHAVPAALKNFLDIVGEDSIYEHKAIGLISVNRHGQVYGAYHAQDAINGILSYKKMHSFVVPRVTVIDLDDIDEERISEFIEYCSGFVTMFHD